MKSLVLFNNKGGVGKTTLTFNFAHMAARLGLRVVVLDYDPQCNVSSIFLAEDTLADLWDAAAPTGSTVASSIDLVRRGKGEVRDPVMREVAERLFLLPGDLLLSRFEQSLAEEWPKTGAAENERALAVTTALDLLSNRAAAITNADIVFADVGPSLGALNRAALLACDFVVLPLAPDLFSLQGLRNVGPTLNEWRRDWDRVRENHLGGRDEAQLPPHAFKPVGYIVQQHLARADRPVLGYRKWAEQIPAVYAQEVLGETKAGTLSFEEDPNCIARLKHFSSLVPLAQVARKPLFDLKQADGISGGQIQAVAQARKEFEQVVRQLCGRMSMAIPE